MRNIGESNRFLKNSEKSFDANNIALLTREVASQWLSFRLDIVGALLSFGVAAFSAGK